MSFMFFSVYLHGVRWHSPIFWNKFIYYNTSMSIIHWHSMAVYINTQLTQASNGRIHTLMALCETDKIFLRPVWGALQSEGVVPF